MSNGDLLLDDDDDDYDEAKLSYAIRGGGTFPWQKCGGPVPGSSGRDQSLIDESGTF